MQMILSLEITNLLKKWVVEHIENIDKKYSDFLVKCGVK